MRRRITAAIVGVTAFVLLALGVPLAIVADRSIVNSEVVELQVRAAHLLTEIELPLHDDDLRQLLAEEDPPPPFGLYDTAGRRVYGSGPETGDEPVSRALGGTTASSTEDVIVVATPITDREERVVYVARLAESRTGAESRVRTAWLVMAIAGAAAIGAAWFIARRLADHMSRPLLELADAALGLGSGGLLAEPDPTGIREIDVLATTLAESSQRMNESLTRERRFSADVSHQLRTPLASLRIRLEAVGHEDDPEELASDTLADLARLEETVLHLLSFARDALPPTTTSSIAEALDAAAARWAERAGRAHRAIHVGDRTDARVSAAPNSVDQILEVLIDNALRHGSGAVVLSTRKIAGGVSLDVRDDGSLPEGPLESMFLRRTGTIHGIGLALGRSLAEAEGGRLLVTRRRPTTFSLILLSADDEGSVLDHEQPRSP